MYLPNSHAQAGSDHIIYDASAAIASGGTAQLILPIMPGRAALEIFNPSDTPMYLGFGGATASATITSGKVTSITVGNAGFGYTIAPKVVFIGGGNTGWNMNNPTFLGGNQVGYPAPAHPATAHCVMSGSAGALTVGSIVIDDPGTGYAIAPKVFLQNDPNDPYGAFAPSTGGIGSILLPASGTVPYIRNGTTCFTDQVSIICATTSKNFTAKYMV